MRPFVALPAPVYVYLKANEKFVAVKGPLDFFTPEELERMRPMGGFFLPEFVDLVARFVDAGRLLRELLEAPEDSPIAHAAPYELSDSALRIAGGLWANDDSDLGLESFFVAAFVGELCGPLPAELLREAYERDIEGYEHATFTASWAVFLAIHLGYLDAGCLKAYRERIFAECSRREEKPARGELDELAAVVRGVLGSRRFRELRGRDFAALPGRAARKVVGRLIRVQAELAPKGQMPPTIFGERGFVHE